MPLTGRRERNSPGLPGAGFSFSRTRYNALVSRNLPPPRFAGCASTRRFPLLSWSLWLLLIVSPAAAADSPPTNSAAQKLKPIIDAQCVSCHDAGQKSGGLDLEHLAIEFNDAARFATWVKVHDRVRNGEMPPKKKARPEKSVLDPFLRELDQELAAADRKRTEGTGRAVYRRLNRTEYENTLRDLLDAPWLNLKELLPEDGRAFGYDKCGASLDISYVQMAKYMEVADYALAQATAITLKPPANKPVRMVPTDQYDFMILLTNSDCVFLKDGKFDPRVPLVKDQYHRFETMIKEGKYKEPGTVGVFRHLDDAFGGRCAYVAAWPGKYKIRMSVWGFQWEKGIVKPATRTEAVAVIVGGRVVGHLMHVAEADRTRTRCVHEFGQHAGPESRLALAHPRFGTTGTGYGVCRSRVAIDWVEVEGPFFDTWPPPSQAPVQRFAAHAARKDPAPGVARPHRELPKRPDNGHNGRNSHGPFEFAAGARRIRPRRPRSC